MTGSGGSIPEHAATRGMISGVILTPRAASASSLRPQGREVAALIYGEGVTSGAVSPERVTGSQWGAPGA